MLRKLYFHFAPRRAWSHVNANVGGESFRPFLLNILEWVTSLKMKRQMAHMAIDCPYKFVKLNDYIFILILIQITHTQENYNGIVELTILWKRRDASDCQSNHHHRWLQWPLKLKYNEQQDGVS